MNARQRRAREMPTEKEALATMFDAYHRLQELGWREACYCPKDGSTFNVIEPGSTGIHKAHYLGGWPDGTFWLEDSGDLWPSSPVLYREATSDGKI